MAKTDGRASYTSANALPVKLLMSRGAKELRPVHVNWYPTNACNLKCNYCAFSKRDKALSMDMRTAVRVIHDFARLECEAVSITGGGEPLCHPNVADMISEFHSCGIKIGLVTNGTLLGRLDKKTLEMLQWCRISSSCPFDDAYRNILDKAIEADVEWGFSHVIEEQPNVDHIVAMVDYAQRHKFTHVRLVADMTNEGRVSDWQDIENLLADKDGFVIYQKQKTAVKAKRCVLGYVRPVVAPDWNVYLCCGAQLALDVVSLDTPSELLMGDARDLKAIYGGQRKPFDVNCAHCYYGMHNSVLEVLTSDVDHKEFV